ncbi:cell division protein FtsX [Ectothiorhodospiraceae bacterium BW-2]|nr:cell division protein FtsX [Ectothiorhodospiraceae bacterium BW-2]
MKPPASVTIRRHRHTLRGRLRHYAAVHLFTLFSTLGELVEKPLATLMTVMVIAIALTLPTGLHLLIKNSSVVIDRWDDTMQLTLFLRPQLSSSQTNELLQQLRRQPEIAAVEFVSKERALAEFRQYSGLESAIDALDTNPLPDMVHVTPAHSMAEPFQLQQLQRRLSELPDIELAQLDMTWVERLQALVELTYRSVSILTLLLSLGVILVVGNTIRLAIDNRREEISIMKLIGATDGFIHRPFLYTGFWYGLCGGLIAVILVESALGLLQPSVAELAQLYHSQLTLQGLTLTSLTQLLFGSALLGLVGSWLAVARHLKDD